MSAPSAIRYASVQELQSRLTGTFSSPESAVMESMLDAASNMVEEFTGDRFYQLAATARKFTPEWHDVLVVPSLVSVSELATDDSGNGAWGRVWASTDYVLYPWNASDEGRPYTEIHISKVSSGNHYSYPAGVQRGVRVTGTWGWPQIPAPVREVVLLEAARMWGQMQSPSGVVASAELGAFLVAPDLHPTSKRLLEPYRRMRIGSASGERHVWP